MNGELRRSLDDRRLAGVCGGLAAYFNIDSTLVRIVFVLLTLAYGGGLFAYLVAWLIIPEASGLEAANSIEYRRPAGYDTTRRLYRSRTDRRIAGVCGGLAEYLKVDPTLIRLILVIMLFMYGTGALFYLICALVIPEQPY